MAKLVLCHVAKLSKIKQIWHLQMICSKFAIEVNPFFRPVFQKEEIVSGFIAFSFAFRDILICNITLRDKFRHPLK